MAVTETIQEILQGIDDAQYGRDMRQYIHKGIQKCYEEGSAGETDLVAREAVEGISTSLAPVITSLVADQNYAKGAIFVYENEMYKTLNAISNGDEMVVGENIDLTTVSDEIKEIGSVSRHSESATISGSTKWRNVATISLTKGVYAISASVKFGQETSNGKVGIGLDTSSGTDGPDYGRTERNGTGETNSYMSTCDFFEISSARNVYVKAYNNNADLNTYTKASILKIR